ncbi:MAG: class I SAM-dependent methyltransferase [Chloroflexota bacterium]|nr:class I SAM-dependent methyltransferase [Chloroflexota bacterium]
MGRLSDRRYLLTEQYRDATNLRARMRLHERFSTNRYPWHRWVFDRFDLPAESRVLELGCGSGRLWAENLDRLPAGWSVTLSDLSPGMLWEARQALSAARSAIAFVNADAQALPFASGAFDAVVANHMLYHVPERGRAYAEIHRVLRPSGRLFAATNGRNHMRELSDLVRKFAATTGFTSADAGTPVEERLGFRLEDGGAELSSLFPVVRLERYEDALVVSEAAPLVDYILSGAGLGGWEHLPSDPTAGEARARLLEFVERELAASGAVRITKDAGLFIARRGDGV